MNYLKHCSLFLFFRAKKLSHCQKITFLILLIILLNLSFFLEAHDGHHSSSLYASELIPFLESPQGDEHLATWLNKIGRFHLLFLHFPIALIVMTVVAEWLWIWFRNPIFDHAARFMILAAAIFVIPTALLGFAFGYKQMYEETSLDLYLYHRNFGLLTAFLAVITAILRERYVRQLRSSLTSYYLSLFFLFICLSLTGAFGGALAFGLDVW